MEERALLWVGERLFWPRSSGTGALWLEQETKSRPDLHVVLVASSQAVSVVSPTSVGKKADLARADAVLEADSGVGASELSDACGDAAAGVGIRCQAVFLHGEAEDEACGVLSEDFVVVSDRFVFPALKRSGIGSDAQIFRPEIIEPDASASDVFAEGTSVIWGVAETGDPK